MNGIALILSDGLIMATALWGQYWRDKAHRLQDAIEYMLEEQAEQEETPAE